MNWDISAPAARCSSVNVSIPISWVTQAVVIYFGFHFRQRQVSTSILHPKRDAWQPAPPANPQVTKTIQPFQRKVLRACSSDIVQSASKNSWRSIIA